MRSRKARLTRVPDFFFGGRLEAIAISFLFVCSLFLFCMFSLCWVHGSHNLAGRGCPTVLCKHRKLGETCLELKAHVGLTPSRSGAPSFLEDPLP